MLQVFTNFCKYTNYPGEERVDVSDTETQTTTDQSNDQVLPKLHTSCRNCVFATWGKPGSDEQDATELVQVGCRLGRLDEFRRLDPEGGVLDAFDDSGVGFCVVAGRTCNAYRDDRSGWDGREPSMDRLMERVREEVRVRFAAIVVLGEDTTEEGLYNTAHSLLDQPHPPEEVFFVNHQKTLHPARVNSTVWRALGNKLTWRIMAILTEDFDHERAVEQAVKQVKASSWFVVFRAGSLAPKGYFKAIDSALNDHMERFSLVHNDSGLDGLAVQLSFYRHPFVGGSQPYWADDLDSERLPDPPHAQGAADGLGGHLADGPRRVFLDGIVAKATHMARAADRLDMVRTVEDVLKFS